MSMPHTTVGVRGPRASRQIIIGLDTSRVQGKTRPLEDRCCKWVAGLTFDKGSQSLMSLHAKSTVSSAAWCSCPLLNKYINQVILA